MALAKSKRDWEHTAMISSILVNANRGKNQKPVTPDDLNPFSDKNQKKPGEPILSTPNENSKNILSKMLGIK